MISDRRTKAWSSPITRGNRQGSGACIRPLGACSRAVLLAGLVLGVGGDAALAFDHDHARPHVGERLEFHGRWLGIPVGSGSFEVMDIVTLEGRQAYRVRLEGRTNSVLSTFYPIHDILESFIDVETLLPLKFTKDQREGHYRAHEIVTFDHTRRVATYRSVLNDTVKEIDLPESYQDLISAFYWLRRQTLKDGQPLSLNLYTDEKIYQTQITVSGPRPLELLKRGTFSSFILEPTTKFKGLLVKRGRLWVYVTADARRLPLLFKATTPWGPMTAVLAKHSFVPPTTATDAPGDPASP